MGERVHQQPDRDHPVGGHPDHDRGVCRVRVRVDPVPRPRHPVHDRRGAAGRADPDVPDPDPADLQRREPVRLVPRHLAGAHGLRPAAGDLPALQLHVAAAARPVRVGRDRRRVASPDVHPARPAAVDPGPRRDRHLPVPVGLERPAGGARLPRAGCRRPRPADGPLQPDREPRRLMASPDRRRVHHDGRAAARLPAAPAGIRARDPGRLRQVTLARLHGLLLPSRSRAHGMGLRDEILEQPAAAQRLLDSAPTAFAPIAAAMRVAPAAVRRHRRPRHLRQRRHLRAVPAGDPERSDRRPGGAVDDHALRSAPEHGRRAGRRHLAVGPLTGHRRGASKRRGGRAR